MRYSTIFPAGIIAAKRNKILDLSLFRGPVFDRKNPCSGAEFLDETFLRRGNDSLRLVGKEIEQFPDAFVIELGVDIVDQKEGIFPSRGVKNGDVGELQKQQGRTLLTGRSKLPQIMAVEGQVHVVAMRTDESVTGR